MAPREKIDPHDLQQALQSRNVQLKCELCGSPDWVYFEGQVDKESGIALYEEGDLTFAKIPTVCLICEGCGNIKLFSKMVLQKRMGGKRRKAEAEGSADGE